MSWESDTFSYNRTSNRDTYTLQVSDIMTGTTSKHVFPFSDNNITLTGLKTDTTYTISIDDSDFGPVTKYLRKCRTQIDDELN